QHVAQVVEALVLGEYGLLVVGLVLQQLELDHEKIALAHSANLVLVFTDVHRFAKTQHILRGEFEGRFSQLDVEELRRYVEWQSALIIGNERARLRGHVPRSLETVLAFLAALEQIAKADIALVFIGKVP